mmetsp:Transcript_14168/g.27540  ORF Transcript_14168/g.27540 Transcript_14168/m.27540 type:complete len:481 (+) Transcript_14168:163-1605(+)
MSTPVPESRAGNKNSGERRGSISKKSDTQSSTREESYEDEEDEEDAISVLDPEEEAKIFRVEESQLQEYLIQMRLDSLFEELVEEMLVDTPDNPVKYIVDYLFAQFPDQARESSFAKTFPTAANLVGGGIPLTGLAAISTIPNVDDDDEEKKVDGTKRNESSKNSTDVSKKPSPAPKEQKYEGELFRRRGALCAHTPEANISNVSQDSSSNSLPSNEQKKILHDALEKDFFFAQLDKEQREAICQGFRVKKYLQNNVVCQQGQPCQELFVLASGDCKLEMHDNRIITVKPATCFGHAMLLHATKAICTVTVTSEEAHLVSIESQVYKRLLQDFQENIRTIENCKALRNVPLFAENILSEVEVLCLSIDVAYSKVFQPGETLVRQHAPSDGMFVILEGTSRCEQRLSPSDPGSVITHFGVGNWFGEISLITDRPRAASVVAETVVNALVIERDRFVRVFGPLTEILRRDEELFRRFVADKI